MKTLKFTFSIILALLFFSCNNDNEQIIKSTNDSNIFESESSIISGELINWRDKHSSFIKSSLNINFDSKKLLISSLKNSNNHAIILNEIGYDKNNYDNYSMVFLENNYKITKGFITKQEKLTNNKIKMSYFSLDYELLLEVEVDFIENTSIIITNNFHDDFSTVKSTWGDRTIDCLTDVYSNHGWISVWASVQTAFIPETAAALAAYCAGATLGATEEQSAEDKKATEVQYNKNSHSDEKLSEEEFIKHMEENILLTNNN